MLSAISCFTVVSDASAQTTYVWNPGSNTWELASSWSPGGGPPAARDIAEFRLDTNGSDVIEWTGTTGNQRIGQLHFTNGDYTFNNLASNPFQLVLASDADDAFRITGAGQTIDNNGLEIVVAASDALIGEGATFNIGTGSGGRSGGLTVSGLLNVDGNLNVQRGVVSNSFGNIDNGHVTLNSGAIWRNTFDVRVGRFGEGRLTVEGGAKVFSRSGFVAGLSSVPESTGFATISGQGSLWELSDNLAIGGNYGSLEISNQGQVTSGGGNIGYFGADSVGEVTVSGEGSQWLMTDGLSVGRIANGFLTITDKGVVSNGSAVLGDVNSFSEGTVVVDGAGSQWNTAETIVVGRHGTGTLTIENGGLVTSNRGALSSWDLGTSGVGNVTTRGAGSRWDVAEQLNVGQNGIGNLTAEDQGAINVGTRLNLGGDSSTSGGTGTLTLDSGGAVNVAGTTKLWSGGTVDFVSGGATGGTLTTTKFDNSAGGTLNFHNGTLNMSGADGFFDPGTDSFTVDGLVATDLPTFKISNDATITVNDNLEIGNEQAGALRVESSSSLTNTNGYLGIESGSTGTAVVTGTGSRWTNSGGLVVGQNGDATMTIENGGTVSSTVGLIAGDSSSTSVVNVTNNGPSGLGGRWQNSNDLYVGGTSLGEGGDGTLNVHGGDVSVEGTTKLWSGGAIEVDGGTFVTSSLDNSELGRLFIRKGTMVVNGTDGVFDAGYSGFTVSGPESGSDAGEAANLHLLNGVTSTFSGDFNLGTGGVGNLLLGNGASLTNDEGFIGRLSNSYDDTSTATVEQNSTWTNFADLNVGRSGRGILKIESGGTVTSLNGYLAQSGSASEGTVEIRGAGSNWDVAESLIVGSSGTGTITVEGQGQLASENGYIGLSEGAAGTVNVYGTNSSWANIDNLTIGSNSGQSTAGARGTLNVASGGKVSAGGSTYLGFYSGIDPTDPSSGSMNVTGEGSTFATGSDLVVGRDGIGALTINDMGVVQSQTGRIGDLSNGQGTATVSGEASRWTNSDRIYVGNEGQGSLSILDRGTVSSKTAYIGLQEGSSGTVLVRDAGSVWENSSYLNSGGTIDVESGGKVNTGVARIFGGTVSIADLGSELNVNSYLEIASSESATLDIHSGGKVTSTQGWIAFSSSNLNGTVGVSGSKSEWEMTDRLYAGFSGNSTVDVTAGGSIRSHGGDLAALPSSISNFTVSGDGSSWINSGDLNIAGREGGHAGGTSTLTIADAGLVSVATTTSIFSNGSVDMQGGRFEFGQTTLQDFSRVGGTSGSLAGRIDNDSVTDVATLTPFQNNALDLTDVMFTNSEVLYGSAANLGVSVNNLANGELFTSSGEFVHFRGGLQNQGEINNVGGAIRFDERIVNAVDGFIAGRGSFTANGGFSNLGTIAVSGDSDFFGDMSMLSGGSLVTSGRSTTTFYDDVVHNGDEIRTSLGSNTVFFGEFTGAGSFEGQGTVFFEGDLRPGNSPGLLEFGGDVVLGESAWTEIEIAGIGLGEYDQFSIDGDLWTDGQLAVSFIDGFELESGHEFLIADINGLQSGQFDGLDEGDLVGRFSGIDLFISYTGGTGNDIRLFSPVPEPTVFWLVLFSFSGASLVRRRTKC